MLNISLLFLSILIPTQGHDFDIKFRTNQTGYEFVEVQVPTGIHLTKLNRDPYELKITTPTLIQIWSECCGGDDILWAEQRYMEETYKNQGLRVISINLENGKDRQQQMEIVTAFFDKTDKPDEFYLDPLGYAYEGLGATGFPTYFLVSAEGYILFKTSGKSKEGIDVLNTEIQKLLTEFNK